MSRAPCPPYRNLPGSDICWSRLETCSNLFNRGPPPRADTWWLLKYVRTVGKRAVHILLDCFLVFFVVYAHVCGCTVCLTRICGVSILDASGISADSTATRGRTCLLGRCSPGCCSPAAVSRTRSVSCSTGSAVRVAVLPWRPSPSRRHGRAAPSAAEPRPVPLRAGLIKPVSARTRRHRAVDVYHLPPVLVPETHECQHVHTNPNQMRRIPQGRFTPNVCVSGPCNIPTYFT